MSIAVKSILIALVSAFTVGCATQNQHLDDRHSVPPGAEALLANAYRLIEAYDKDDHKTWASLICMASTNEKVFGLAASKFLGKFSEPRLVSISSVSEAGNVGDQFQWPRVLIEVKATGYPVGPLMLKFGEDKKQNCVFLIY